MTSSTNPLQCRPRRQDGILAQAAHGETVLLRLQDGGYYALDDVGATIWELCDGSRVLDEIVDRLCADFDAPRSRVTADVQEFVDDLLRERLLVLDAA